MRRHLEAIVSEAQEMVNNALRSDRMSLPPFPPDYRASGVLLHVTSLPSPYGIGDVGAAALAWIDRLHEAGQSWWQALPLGPTGYGDSPYQPLSSFAGNGLLMSPDWLIEDGAAAGERLRGSVIFVRRGRLRRRRPRSSAGCSRRPGPTSMPARVRICGPPMHSSARTMPAGWRTTRCFAR